MPEKVKPAPAPSWLKSVEAIAAAMGLRLYAQRPKKIAQLAAVRALTEAAGFPAKVKGYWPRAEVVAFIAARVEVHKNSREFKLVAAPRAKPEKSGFKSQVSALPLADSPAQREAVGGKPETGNQKPENGELPPAANPAGEDDLFLKLSPEDQYRARLQFNLDIYLNPEKHRKVDGTIVRLTNEEKKELVAAGMIPKLSSDAADEPDGDFQARDCNSETEVAETITRHFRALGHAGVDCRKQYVSDWRKGKRLESGAPLFPPPDPKSNRYLAKEFIPWYERWQLHKFTGAGNTRDLALNLAEERDKAELEEIAHQRWQRELERGEYIARPLALATGIAAVRQIHQLVKVEDERALPKMRREHLTTLLNAETIPADVVARVVAAFAAYDIEQARGVTDRREHAMATVGNAKQVKLLEEKLKAEQSAAAPVNPLPEGKLV